MLADINSYLKQVQSYLRLDPVTERQVVGELYSHFEAEIDELKQKGISEEYATSLAIESCGRPKVVARLMYEAYSKGTWTDAARASLPHLLVAALFIFHLWDDLFWAPLIFGIIVSMTFFGWWHGKPNWLYSWIGYSLLPLLVIGYVFWPALQRTISSLPGQNLSLIDTGTLLVAAAVILTALVVIVRTAIRVTKRDWLLASLMLVPLPIMGSWLFNITQVWGTWPDRVDMLHQWDTALALAFFLLSIASVVFIRLRDRAMKAGDVITIGSLALAMVGHNLWGGLSLLGITGLFVSMLVFLFTPAMVDARMRSREQNSEA